MLRFATMATQKKSYRPFTASTVAALISLALGTLSLTLAPASQASAVDSVSVKSINIDCHTAKAMQASNPTYQSAHQRTINCMMTELNSYQQQQRSARQRYFAYKAQAWLNYAYHEDSINSRSIAGKQAFEAADTILQALKSGTENRLDLTTDIPTTSALMRPDLWATLSALKDRQGIDQAPRELAYSEIALIWAAANHCQQGWRQSSAHFRMADRWLQQAREAYVNAHNSTDNVALEELINQYYKHYAPLDPSDDVCRGQTLANNISITKSQSL